ncbi:hypothetical protein [Piscinibacter sp. HJYY11]|uniref:hypothetical protein n=1 Tax=Piscinibacter sp. HJYY11 TaxID=2801333 RepID=UPI00191E7F83|nr:hypothetical protein [Piscinibacter sp. HJYY11]MBL0726082.1 hypothetical protein [Piscinibacter sp. HJYY11]
MTIESPYHVKYGSLELFLGSITQREADPTYSLLKTHLVFEEVLRDYIQSRLPHPQALDGARLTFAQRLAVARAISTHVSPDNWHWVAIADLNKLRNLLAHNLQPAELRGKIESYTESVIGKLGVSLPEPKQREEGIELPEEEIPRYSAFDMANAALFTYSCSLLGLVSADLIAREQRREGELRSNAVEPPKDAR